VPRQSFRRSCTGVLPSGDFTSFCSAPDPVKSGPLAFSSPDGLGGDQANTGVLFLLIRGLRLTNGIVSSRRLDMIAYRFVFPPPFRRRASLLSSFLLPETGSEIVIPDALGALSFADISEKKFFPSASVGLPFPYGTLLSPPAPSPPRSMKCFLMKSLRCEPGPRPPPFPHVSSVLGIDQRSGCSISLCRSFSPFDS